MRKLVSFTLQFHGGGIMKFLKKGHCSVLEIDKNVKNKFRWDWLERKVTVKVKIGKKHDEVTESLGQFLRKSDVPGKVYCVYCNDLISYGSRGCVSLVDHATKAKRHAKRLAIRRSNSSLGSASSKHPSTKVKDANHCGTLAEATASNHRNSLPITPLADKQVHSEVRDSGPQSTQQTLSLARRDQSCLPYSEGRKVMLPQTTSFNPTSTRSVKGLHFFRQGYQQRANMPTRSIEQSPRVGIQIPLPGQSSTGPQNASSSIRVQAPTSQQQSSLCQQSNMDTGPLSSLQEHVRSLASEVHSLGLALRMMVEQQGRLEREQSQQTHIQKQILNTLQKLAIKQESCSFQHSTTPTVPACPLSSASYSQSTFTPSQGVCSQVQSRYNEMDGSTLDNIEPFSLDSVNSATMNGFQTPDSPSFDRTHSPPFTQSHTQTFTPEIVSCTQPHTDSYAGMGNKSGEVASPNTDKSFQVCTSSSLSSESISVHDAQLTIVKIENV